MTTQKPYFVCPLEIKYLPSGAIEFHVTTRDGQTQIHPGPPGVTRITSNVEAFQPKGSDDVRLLFAGGGPKN